MFTDGEGKLYVLYIEYYRPIYGLFINKMHHLLIYIMKNNICLSIIIKFLSVYIL